MLLDGKQYSIQEKPETLNRAHFVIKSVFVTKLPPNNNIRYDTSYNHS